MTKTEIKEYWETFLPTLDDNGFELLYLYFIGLPYHSDVAEIVNYIVKELLARPALLNKIADDAKAKLENQ